VGQLYGMRYISLVLLLGVVLPCPMTADVYKWVDDQGRVHYGDRPPDATLAPSPVTLPEPEPIPSQPAQDARRKSQQLLEIYREERLAKQAAAEEHRQAKQAKQEKCRLARLRYARFESAGGIYQKHQDGERSYLDHARRDEFMRNLKAEVTRWCGRD
jgi:hypothetical protein